MVRDLGNTIYRDYISDILKSTKCEVQEDVSDIPDIISQLDIADKMFYSGSEDSVIFSDNKFIASGLNEAMTDRLKNMGNSMEEVEVIDTSVNNVIDEIKETVNLDKSSNGTTDNMVFNLFKGLAPNNFFETAQNMLVAGDMELNRGYSDDEDTDENDELGYFDDSEESEYSDDSEDSDEDECSDDEDMNEDEIGGTVVENLQGHKDLEFGDGSEEKYSDDDEDSEDNSDEYSDEDDDSDGSNEESDEDEYSNDEDSEDSVENDYSDDSEDEDSDEDEYSDDSDEDEEFNEDEYSDDEDSDENEYSDDDEDSDSEVSVETVKSSYLDDEDDLDNDDTVSELTNNKGELGYNIGSEGSGSKGYIDDDDDESTLYPTYFDTEEEPSGFVSANNSEGYFSDDDEDDEDDSSKGSLGSTSGYIDDTDEDEFEDNFNGSSTSSNAYIDEDDSDENESPLILQGNNISTGVNNFRDNDENSNQSLSMGNQKVISNVGEETSDDKLANSIARLAEGVIKFPSTIKRGIRSARDYMRVDDEEVPRK